MELSKRLQAVADLLSKDLCVADIGTDHGYIPIYCITSGKSSKVIAMDINEGPLLRAKRNIAEHGLTEQIETRISDGVTALKQGECDAVIVAGMGGALVIKIMEAGEQIFRSLQEFVLQPQSELEKVRQYLCGHGYDIIAEDMVLEEGKFYPMMKVINQNTSCYNKMELRYGKFLLKQRHPVLQQFLEKEMQMKEQILRQLGHDTGVHIEKRKQELYEELLVIKEALETYF